MTAPLFRRGDSVYLRSSAELGKLESYKITATHQTKNDQWLYRINITKKPPNSLSVGDTFDARMAEPSIFFLESELITLCEALDIIKNFLNLQIQKLESIISSSCGDTINQQNSNVKTNDDPKWNIGDKIYFVESAKLGFMHSDFIESIHDSGIQPGSRQIQYLYSVKNIPNKKILFREFELTDFCSAASIALEALNRDLSSTLTKIAKHCIS